MMNKVKKSNQYPSHNLERAVLSHTKTAVLGDMVPNEKICAETGIRK
jgi:hypothetical protein